MNDPATRRARARIEYRVACTVARAELEDLLAGADGGPALLLERIERARVALSALRAAETDA